MRVPEEAGEPSDYDEDTNPVNRGKEEVCFFFNTLTEVSAIKDIEVFFISILSV